MTFPAPEIITPKSGELFDQQVKLAWTKTHPFLFYYFPGFSNILVERGTEGTYISKSGRIEVADPNTPRITWWDRDGDGVRETPALRLEPQRTNLVPSPRLDTDSNGDGIPDGVVVSAHADYTVTPLSLSDGEFTFRVERVADTGGWGGGIRIDIPGIMQGDVLSSGIDVLVTPGSTPLVGATRYFWEYTDDATGLLVTTPVVQYPGDGQWHRLLAQNVSIANPVRANTFRLIVRSGGGSDPIGGSVTVSVRRPQIERGPTASSLILPPPGAPGAATRATDTVTVPWAHGLGSFTGYFRFVETGAADLSLATIAVWLFGNNTGNGRIWLRSSSINPTYFVTLRDSRGQSAEVVASPGVTTALGNLVELMPQIEVSAQGVRARLIQAVNGGAPATSAWTPYVQADWTPTTMRLGSLTPTQFDLLDAIVLRGAGWTMDQVREVISDLDWYRRRESTIYR